MSHISAEARAQAGETKKRRTREKLIHAADYVMRGVGMAATVEAIAEEAGVSVPTFYNFYRSRNDLCQEAVGVLVLDQVERADRRSFIATAELFAQLCAERPSLVRAAIFSGITEREDMDDTTSYGGKIPSPPKLHSYPYLEQHLDLEDAPGWLAYLLVDDDIAAAAHPRDDDPMHVERIAKVLKVVATDLFFMAALDYYEDAHLLEDIVRRTAGI
jgi:AcrR family transcriptional regulator